MKQKTSNNYMERPEDLLTTIKKVQPDSQLYTTIRQRIKNKELQLYFVAYFFA
jgi:hypothetical protein